MSPCLRNKIMLDFCFVILLYEMYFSLCMMTLSLYIDRELTDRIAKDGMGITIEGNDGNN